MDSPGLCNERGPERLTVEEIESLVARRDNYRAIRDYARADDIKKLLATESVEIVDYSFKSSLKSTWSFKPKPSQTTVRTNLMELAHNSYSLLQLKPQEEVVQEAKDLIKAQRYQSLSRDNVLNQDKSNCNFQQSCPREESTERTSTEMQGRKYADAAFEFSMSGVDDAELFEMLADGAESELKRFGSRPRCRPVSILHVIEKLAVAGIRNHSVYETAKEILQAKKVNAEQFAGGVNTSVGYSLFSNRPLLWLWRYASKQKKEKTNTNMLIAVENGHTTSVSSGCQPQQLANPNTALSIPIDDELTSKSFATAAQAITSNSCDSGDDNSLDGIVLQPKCSKITSSNHQLTCLDAHSSITPADMVGSKAVKVEVDCCKYEEPDFADLFVDTTLPLVVDLGCGYGVSILQLCEHRSKNHFGRKLNFLGIDLSRRATKYANGIANRWGYCDFCAFVYNDCVAAIKWIHRHYDGPTVLVMMNFPTPYSLSTIQQELTELNLPTSVEGVPISTVGDEDNTSTAVGRDSVVDNDTITSTNPSCKTRMSPGQRKQHSNGNSQLPSTLDSFLCNVELVKTTYSLLLNQYRTSLVSPSDIHGDNFSAIGVGNEFNSTNASYIRPCMLLQSNVEDVAVTMRNIVLQSMIEIRNELVSINKEMSNASATNITQQMLQDPALCLPSTTSCIAEVIENIFQCCKTPPVGHEKTGTVLPLDKNDELGHCIYKTLEWVSVDQLNKRTKNLSGNIRRTPQRLTQWLNNFVEKSDGLDAFNLDSVANKTIESTTNFGILSTTSMPLKKHKSTATIVPTQRVTSTAVLMATSRALGCGWLSATPLPFGACTETEVHCDFETAQNVHRIVFVMEEY